jgi:hypothetical protein
MTEQNLALLGDIEFFSGVSAWEVLEAFEDHTPRELFNTLSELKSRIVTRLIEQGRTYEQDEA